jgi:hypothetical protein
MNHTPKTLTKSLLLAGDFADAAANLQVLDWARQHDAELHIVFINPQSLPTEQPAGVHPEDETKEAEENIFYDIVGNYALRHEVTFTLNNFPRTLEEFIRSVQQNRYEKIFITAPDLISMQFVALTQRLRTSTDAEIEVLMASKFKN